MPKFSVIIPLYNKENFIEKTLNSVLNQTFTDFEILIVNDSSTDASLQKASMVLDKRIRIIEHIKNRGLSASRNTGIKNAYANYIAFLDADDFWKPTYLEKINFLIINYPQASLFATKYEVLLLNKKVLEYEFFIKGLKNEGLVPNFFKSNLNQSIYYPSCLCVYKHVFEDIGYYNESINYSEDIDFNIRAHAKYKLAYSKQALVTYVLVSENQITQSSIFNKSIPDYDYYEKKFKGRRDIKKYLDFQRYVKAKQYKLANDHKNFKKMVDAIDFKNLNWKQKSLLILPNILLKYIGKTKQLLETKGIEVSSYSK